MNGSCRHCGAAQSCDASTFEMVECLNAKTAEWDEWMNAAYQQALKDSGECMRSMTEARASELENLGHQ